MTFLRKLEYFNIPVTAAVTAAAPVDAATIINRWLNNYQPGDAIWLPACASNFIFAREYYNKMPGLARRAIRPEYYQAAKDFYDFKIDWPTFRSLTKDKIYEMFTPEFLAAGNFPYDVFWKSLEAAEAYRWRCRTPLINYYGEKDEVIPPYIAKLAEGWHNIVGFGKTKAISAGPNADHRATYVYSVIQATAFYESFLKKK
jgi:pimeloyl-ACP methyl ester carboxylesterase